MANTNRRQKFVMDAERKVKVTVLKRNCELIRTNEQVSGLAELMKWASVVYILGSTDKERGSVLDLLRDLSSRTSIATKLIEVRPANFGHVLLEVGNAVRDSTRKTLFVASTWEDLYECSGSALGYAEYVFASTPNLFRDLRLPVGECITEFLLHKRKVGVFHEDLLRDHRVGDYVRLIDDEAELLPMRAVARVTSRNVYADLTALLTSEGLYRVFPTRAKAIPEGTELAESISLMVAESHMPLSQPITALGLKVISNPLIFRRRGGEPESMYFDAEPDKQTLPEFGGMEAIEWKAGELELPDELYEDLVERDGGNGSGSLRHFVWMSKLFSAMLSGLGKNDIDPSAIVLNCDMTAEYLSVLNFQNMPFPQATGASRTYDQLLRFGPCLAVTRVEDPEIGEEDVDPVALSLAKVNNRLLRFDPALLDQRFMDVSMLGKDTNYPAYLWSIAYGTSIMSATSDEEKTSWPGLTLAEARSGVPNPVLMSTSPFGVQYERSPIISVVPLLQSCEALYPRGSVASRATDIDFALGVVRMVTEGSVCPPIAWRIDEPNSLGSGYFVVTSAVSGMHYVGNILDENVDPLQEFHLFLEEGYDLLDRSLTRSLRHPITLITFAPGSRTFHVRINRKGQPPISGQVAVCVPPNVYMIEKSRGSSVALTLCRRKDVQASSFIFFPAALTCIGFNHYSTAISIAVSSLGKGGQRKSIRQIVQKATHAADDIDLSGHLQLAAQLNGVTFIFYLSTIVANLLGWRLDLVYKFDGQSSSDWHTIREYVETCDLGLGDGVTALERANFTICKNILGRLDESEIGSKRPVSPDAFFDYFGLIEALLEC